MPDLREEQPRITVYNDTFQLLLDMKDRLLGPGVALFTMLLLVLAPPPAAGKVIVKDRMCYQNATSALECVADQATSSSCHWELL